MNIHYYGILNSLESCYTFQEYEVEDLRIYIQNSTRFGYEPATITIKNPALFVFDGISYHRYVLEDFKIEVINGYLNLNNQDVQTIIREIKKLR